MPPSNPNPSTLRTGRRPRMSVHSFLPGSVFRTPPPGPTLVPDVARSPPTTRRLRKTRSIPNGLSSADGASVQPSPHFAGRPHAHSVSSADAFAPPPPPPMSSDGSRAPTRDFFADVMNWPTVPPSPFGSSSSSQPFRYQVSSSPPSPHGDIAHPFGPGVSFESPSWRSPTHLTSPPILREMQSFESGLTARADYLPRMARMSRLSLAGTSDSDDARTQAPPPGDSTLPIISSASSVAPIPRSLKRQAPCLLT